MVRAGTTLVGTTATIGTCAMASCDLTFNQQISGLIPRTNNLDDAFLFYWIQYSKPIIESLAAGTSFKRITTSILKAVPINYPPLPEQKRIVDLISSVDLYIEVLRQQLESARRSRNAVLHELLTVGGDDWEYKILSDICEVRDGTHDSPKPSNEGFALVTSKNIKDGKLDLESAYLISPQDYVEVNKRSKVEQYNLLISMIGTIGEVIVVEEEPHFAIKNVGLLKSTDPILSRYLCHYLGSQLGKNTISLSVSGSTQKFISLGKLRELPVLYPPRENQKAIVEAMSLFDQQISKNLEVADRIKNLRSSLLSDLLSGEHEIPASYDKVIGAAG
jgi:type I restriction enzyme S subunit